jgi:hypothetical protein
MLTNELKGKNWAGEDRSVLLLYLKVSLINMPSILIEWHLILSVFAQATGLSCLFIYLFMFKGLKLMSLYGNFEN